MWWKIEEKSWLDSRKGQERSSLVLVFIQPSTYLRGTVGIFFGASRLPRTFSHYPGLLHSHICFHSVHRDILALAKIRTIGRLLLTLLLYVVSHKIQIISWLSSMLLGYQEGICTIELFKVLVIVPETTQTHPETFPTLQGASSPLCLLEPKAIIL